MFKDADENEINGRLDLKVMQAFQTDLNAVQATRRHILNAWREDAELSKLSLSHLKGLDGISEREDDLAVRNIVDYWFEPYVIPSMNLGQIRDYYLGVRESMQLEVAEGSDFSADGPMVLQTLHHYCIFSVVACVIQQLVEEAGYCKVVLLHLNNPPDVRLEGCRAIAENLLNVQVSFIQIKDDWLKRLGREMTDRTIVIYMGDMPPSQFLEHHRPGKTSSHLQLSAKPGLELRLEGISIAAFLARRFKAAHFLLDFPGSNLARLRPWQEGSELCCPLPDWAFWPITRLMYEEIAPPRDHRGPE